MRTIQNGELGTNKCVLYSKLPGKWEEERLQEDLVAIIEYYNKEGFLYARIISHDEYIEENRYKFINVYIEKGERFFFRSLSISGNVHF